MTQWLMRAALAALFVPAALAAPMATDAMADTVLAQMSSAFKNRAWTGTLVYTKGMSMVSLRIHRDIVGGQPVERMERLSGDPVQMMRRGNWLLGLYPGKEVLRQGYPVPSASLPPLAQRLSHIKQHYTLSVLPEVRVANRRAVPVKLTATDGLRFNRLFWCDTETGLMLRSQTLEGDRVLEQFEFLEVTMGEPLNEDTLVVDAQGMEVFRHALIPSAADVLTTIDTLPKGFIPLSQTTDPAAGVSQLVTDGVSLVSIFYEKVSNESIRLRADDGPTHAVSQAIETDLGWVKVTAVGEVPPPTLEALLQAVDGTRVASLFSEDA